MMQPSSRLVAMVAAGALPLLAIAGFYPGVAGICYVALVVSAVAACADLGLALRALGGWSATAPALVRWFRDREDSLTITLRHASEASGELRLHAVLPSDIEAKEPTLTLRLDGDGIAEFVCIARRRGDFQLAECHLQRRSAMGLWLVSARLPLACEIRVYPDLRRERVTDLTPGRLEGVRRRRQLGKGREFEKLREYQPGDSFEDIDWKATARRNGPVVRVFQLERMQDVFIAIDSSRLSARGGALDSYVSAALTLAMAAEGQHDRFGLAAFSSGVDRFLSPAAGKRHFAVCRDAIYGLQPQTVTPDTEEIFSFLQAHLHKRSLLVFLTALDDPALAEGFVRNIHVLSRRHLVLVNLPEQRDVRALFSGPVPESPDEVYGRLAGHLQWAALRELQKTLAQHGVSTTFADPARLSAHLVRQYRNVKQGQRL